MKKITFILLFCISTFGFSQTWFENNAQWKYKYWNFDTRVGYTQLNVVGEEMQGGVLCKKIHAVRYLEDLTQTPPFPSWTEDLGYFYAYASTSNNQVYYFINNQFYTLYDFDTPIGGSWTIYNAHPSISCSPNEGTVFVTNKGTEVVDGQTLQYMDVYSTGSASLGGRIYQKTGAIDVFFFPEYRFDYPDCGLMSSDATISDELLCYEEDNFLHNNGTNQCYTISLSTNDATLENNSIQLYKNLNDLVFEYNTQVSDFKISVFTISGKQLLQKIEMNTNRITISKSNMSTGVYIAIIELDGKKQLKKFSL